MVGLHSSNLGDTAVLRHRSCAFKKTPDVWKSKSLFIISISVLQTTCTEALLSPSPSLSIFIFSTTTLHYQVNGSPDETRGCKISRKKKKEKTRQKAVGGRLKCSPACESTNTEGVVALLFLPTNKSCRMRRNTIWPQLQAPSCKKKKTKINGDSSTLDAHHYPDGVVREVHGLPNHSELAPPPTSTVYSQGALCWFLQGACDTQITKL